LHVLEKYLLAAASGIIVTITQRHGVAIASILLLNADFEGAIHVSDGSLSHLCKIIREVSNTNWRPNSVLMARPRPQNARAFSEFYHAPIEYGSTDHALVFDASELYKIIPGRNRKQFEILVAVLERAREEQLGSLRVDLKSMLRQLISTGSLSQKRVAMAFNLKERTFVRHLEQAGICFSALVDEVRFETSRSLLRTDIKLIEIAAVLGYAEASVFTRSFKRWSGETPSAWRMKHTNAETSTGDGSERTDWIDPAT
jgi:AraC-like DNA-binding protein